MRIEFDVGSEFYVGSIEIDDAIATPAVCEWLQACADILSKNIEPGAIDSFALDLAFMNVGTIFLPDAKTEGGIDATPLQPGLA